MIFNRNILNNRGIGIIEVVVAGALLTIIGLGAASLLDTSIKTQKGIQAKSQQLEVIASIGNMLAVPSSCINSFAGQNPVTGFPVNNLRDSSNNVIFASGTKDKSGLLEFQPYMIGGGVEWNAPLQTANMTVWLKKVDTGTGAIDQKEKISIYIVLDSFNRIITCQSVSAGDGSGDLWDLTPSSVTNIFYKNLAGNVGIGTNNPTEKLEVNGNIVANSINWLSDGNLKTIKSKAPGIALVKKLNGYNFIWKETGKEDYGVIAQEIEALLPELVTLDSLGRRHVNYTALTPLLIESIKELNLNQKILLQKINRLQDDIKILKNKNP